MKYKPEKTMGLILREPHTQLQPLVKKVRQLNEFNSMLQHLLAGSNLQHKCSVVNWRDGCLVIAADNASLCNLLRYQCPDLLSRFRQSGFYQLQSIVCQVKPYISSQSVSSHGRAPKLSRVAESFLQELVVLFNSRVD